MSPLHEALRDYLQIRRSLGYQLKQHERLLEDFLGFLEDSGATRITTELAVAWARLPQDVKPWWWAARLGIVRGFARHLATIDPQSEVPPKDLLAAREQRLAPYIYSPAEITALMDAAEALAPAVRGATHRTLIGLLAVTGLRLGEALALERVDVDLTDGVLHVHGKNGKPRELPLHETTTRALGEYARLRDRTWPEPQTAAFFVCSTGRPLRNWVVHKTFPQLIRQVGLERRARASARARARTIFGIPMPSPR